MRERRRRARLLLEALQPFGIGGAWQDFDGDFARETGVARPIDLTHSPRAEGREDVVRSEAGPSRKAHESRKEMLSRRVSEVKPAHE